MSRLGSVYLLDRFAGTIKETDDGKYIFTYDESYLESFEPEAVSSMFPLRKEPYVSDFLFPFFDELIPDGWLLNVSLNDWKLDLTDRMGLLLAACEDSNGSIKVLPAS